MSIAKPSAASTAKICARAFEQSPPSFASTLKIRWTICRKMKPFWIKEFLEKTFNARLRENFCVVYTRILVNEVRCISFKRFSVNLVLDLNESASTTLKRINLRALLQNNMNNSGGVFCSYSNLSIVWSWKDNYILQAQLTVYDWITLKSQATW